MQNWLRVTLVALLIASSIPSVVAQRRDPRSPPLRWNPNDPYMRGGPGWDRRREDSFSAGDPCGVVARLRHVLNDEISSAFQLDMLVPRDEPEVIQSLAIIQENPQTAPAAPVFEQCRDKIQEERKIFSFLNSARNGGISGKEQTRLVQQGNQVIEEAKRLLDDAIRAAGCGVSNNRNLYTQPPDKIPRDQQAIYVAKVDATLDRRTGMMTVTDLDGKGGTVTVPVWSGNGKYGIGYQGGEGGDGRYDNKGDAGPIPRGDYLIGNGYSDQTVEDQHPGGDSRWYRLYGADGKGGYSYSQLWNGRNGFNFHTGRRSNGCVTIPSDVPETDPNYPKSEAYNALKRLLDGTSPMPYKPGDTFRGILHVK